MKAQNISRRSFLASSLAGFGSVADVRSGRTANGSMTMREDLKGNKVSLLGYGAMRLPTKDGKHANTWAEGVSSAAIDQEAKKIFESQPTTLGRYLANYSNKAADEMMQRWDRLYKYLIVKHNDMVVKREKDGQFERTPDGNAAPTIRPGYPAQFSKRVAKETGNRYKMK